MRRKLAAAVYMTSAGAAFKLRNSHCEECVYIQALSQIEEFQMDYHFFSPSPVSSTVYKVVDLLDVFLQDIRTENIDTSEQGNENL